MRVCILAVIPARAGSKGIPNKNIKIINDRPLIEYALQNAINSKYITDYVVTTDSAEIENIVQQQNKNCIIHCRSEELCGDDVTLDSVIYDAIPKDKKYDYIVTLQPTSPTLKSETLDKAIEYAIEKETDTLISVINLPHLSWHDENGKKVPSYKERLNRQYLPADYLETGAFVISKADVVNQCSRIGKKVDVFELSEDEAIDIDSYNDLILAESVLRKKKIGIFVNGNNQIGTGHIYRALELADGFSAKCCIFYDSTKTEKNIFGNTTYQLIPVSSKEELYDICQKEKYTIFINDILSTDIDYMTGLRAALPENCKIINFEDDGKGSDLADLIIDALYDFPETQKIKTGEKYYIAPRSFITTKPIEIRKDVKNIFISFGGADPKNYTDRILKIITKPEYQKYNFTIVLGRAKNNIDVLLNYKRNNICILYDVKNMAVLISENDIAITSRGRTSYELAILGVPSIAMAQNKREEKHHFACKKNGFEYLGNNPSDKKIEKTLKKYLNLSQAKRIELQKKLLEHDLKKGRKRVLEIIESL